MITAIEAYGDITANSLISGEPVEGKVFIKRASGGILADGFNSMLAGILNSFPNSVFAQNNGMIQLTGVASRYLSLIHIWLGQETGVGQKERDNGLVILLSTDERCVQFATGYGLEGILPDAICKRIQNRYMLPYFCLLYTSRCV